LLSKPVDNDEDAYEIYRWKLVVPNMNFTGTGIPIKNCKFPICIQLSWGINTNFHQKFICFIWFILIK